MRSLGSLLKKFKDESIERERTIQGYKSGGTENTNPIINPLSLKEPEKTDLKSKFSKLKRAQPQQTSSVNTSFFEFDTPEIPEQFIPLHNKKSKVAIPDQPKILFEEVKYFYYS
jgi:hypothetical protein